MSLVAALVIVAACSGGETGTRDAAPATTTTAERNDATSSTAGSSTTATTEPTERAATAPAPDGGAAGAPSPAPAQPATPSCPAVPAQAAPPPGRPTYVLDVDVRLDANVVEGGTTVRFSPDLPTDRLVFRLWPNAPRTAAAGARLEVGPVLVGAHPAPARLTDPTTLVVSLPTVLRAGDSVEAAVPWRLTLPGSANDRISRDGDAVRLGSFFPILAWEPGIGWAVEPSTGLFAESSVATVADFSVSVTAPPGLSVLASGEPDGQGRFRATGVRDVAVSVGRFIIAEGVAHAPGPVAVTVGVHEPVGESPGEYLAKVVRSLEDFAARFGPYPYPRLTLSVTPNLGGGIEYPGHILQGPGTIGRTTSHEVGHMWFYSLVGNNQARDPWLDEGLATWAEARYEGTLGSMASRSVPAAGRGRLGEPMTYWARHPDAYYRSVYVQGAQALAALGDADLVDCALRHYVAANAFRIARPPDLLASLEKVFPDADEVLARYGVRA
jgi:hypothetical protein